MTTIVNAITRIIADIIGFILVVTMINVLVPFVVVSLMAAVIIFIPMAAIIFAIKYKQLVSGLYTELMCNFIGTIRDYGKRIISSMKK